MACSGRICGADSVENTFQGLSFGMLPVEDLPGFTRKGMCSNSSPTLSLKLKQIAVRMLRPRPSKTSQLRNLPESLNFIRIVSATHVQ